MASIATDLVKIGLKKGSAWGTAVAVSSGIYLYGRISISGGDDGYFPSDLGFAGKRTTQTFLRRNLSVTFTADLAYSQGVMALVASVMGTESTPSEQTVSQGDYLRNIDLADSNVGLFWTLAWLNEDDDLCELSSVKWTGFTIAQEANGVGTVTVQGVADNLTILAGGAASSVANITGNTPLTYQSAVLGGTNHYFRINADSGAGLSGTDNKPILSYSLSLQRTLDPLFALRGANTKYSLEPTPLGDIVGNLTFQLAYIDDSVQDLILDWLNKSTFKAEIFLDGSQIGSGVNTSYKFQMPLLQPDGPIPSGYDAPAKNQRMQPSLSYAMMKRSAAPTGMTGVTDYLRIVSIDRRSTKWTA